MMKLVRNFAKFVLCVYLLLHGLSFADEPTSNTVTFKWEKFENTSFDRLEWSVSGPNGSSGRKDISFASYLGSSVVFYGGINPSSIPCGTTSVVSLESTSFDIIRYIDLIPSPDSNLWVLGKFPTTIFPNANNPDSIENDRQYSDLWMNSKGDLYVFGGRSYRRVRIETNLLVCPTRIVNSFTTDLVKFDKEKGAWELASIPDLSENYIRNPNEHKSRTWTDLEDNLWLFQTPSDNLTTTSLGMYKFDFELRNFSPILRNNTIESLNSPVPNDFIKAATWTGDDGNLWLFGDGTNTMWKFDIEKNVWFEMNKDSSGDTTPRYGERGVFADSNRPGIRENHAFWKDFNGHFWIHGGYGEGEDGSGFLNDLWKFDVSLNQWAWVSGSSSINDFSNGTEPDLYPSASEHRYTDHRFFWTDADGNLILLGPLREVGTFQWIGTEID